MLSVVTSCLVLLCMVSLGHTKQWAPSDMFDLRYNEECNVETSNERGIKYMMCDPDRILRKSEVSIVNWLLRDAAQNSTCPCSNHFCEVSAPSAFTGYKIGVALIKRMKLEDDKVTGKTNNPRDQAMLFARTLEREKWNMGNCEEDIIIFYAKDDQELAIHVGKTAAARLTSDARLRLMQHSNHFFADGKIIEGLNTLIVNMRGLLDCPLADVNMCELKSLTHGSGAAVATVSVTALVASVLFTIYRLF